jgi:hypothetical protein
MTAGNQTIGGTKTFSSTISGSIDGNAATVTNGVYTTGNQSIGGIKTFTNQTVVFDQNGATSGGYTFNFGTPTSDNVITFPNSGGELTLMGNTFNGANQLLKLDGSGRLPAIDGSALTNLSATNFSSGTVSATRGGTGLSTWTKGSVLYADAANSWAALPGSTTDGDILTWDNTTGLPKWAAGVGSSTNVNITGGTVDVDVLKIHRNNGKHLGWDISTITDDVTTKFTDADWTHTFGSTVGTAKGAKFSVASITAGHTRTYTLPDQDGTLLLSGSGTTPSFGSVSATSNLGTSTASLGTVYKDNQVGAWGIDSNSSLTASFGFSSSARAHTANSGIYTYTLPFACTKALCMVTPIGPLAHLVTANFTYGASTTTLTIKLFNLTGGHGALEDGDYSFMVLVRP